ncbi:hypothetical protein J3R30DRAFT_3734177 [Lentinula aciculospora]|uniref:MI domain-containing protein n=1 Tax=Lentinula aciculospora TaxID=153920 RepID=A0A9W9AA33_9AGAR|nr:hypothetical protein J3R30DRAFT_3734177 [Lentinula aciculospora]
MPVRTKTSTTRLPSSLLEQIRESSGTALTSRRRSLKASSRKESRKQLRAERKHRKAEFFFNNNLKRPVTTDNDSRPKKKAKLSTDAPPKPALPPKVPNSQVKSKSSLESDGQNKTKAIQKLTALEKLEVRNSKGLQLKTPVIRTQQEMNEDAYIAYLEAKLGYAKGKKAKRFDDGLDDLYDFADSLEQSFANDVNKFEYRVEADEENLEDENDEDPEDECEVDEEINGSEDEMEDPEPESFSTEVENKEEEWLGIGGSSFTDGNKAEHSSRLPQVIDPPSANVTHYVPPHLRAKTESKESEEQIKLTRQLKGFLNRMSEQNIASILDSVEETYRHHGRHNVTSTITTLIIDSISSHSTLLDSYVVLYAAFVSSLHKLVGVEFATHFVQNVVSCYEQHLATLSSSDEPDERVEDKGKEASNLVVLLSELYNFQVISCVLVFDIIRMLLKHNIQEFQVELLLKIVRNSGQQLRTDDPLALKDIIRIIQNDVDKQEGSLSSRTRFMLETLDSLRMSKVKRLGTQNQGGEAVERMKKFLGGLNKKRHVLAHEPLRISLDDLHSAQTKGKWWLVGAAWGGDPLVDRQQPIDQPAVSSTTPSLDIASSTALLKLAKKHGMNTDIRRSIFVVLMSSDDYVDACERLSQLKLTEVQQREIVRVVLHCCGNEKVYNPYYALVCQHLCTISHSYKITLQYCLWDFFRDLGETNVGGAEVIKGLQNGGGHDDFGVKSISSTRIKSMAKAYAWWIAKDSITLTVLKPIDFTMLKPQTKMFLQQLFICLFLSSQSKSPLIGAAASSSRNRTSIEEIFTKTSRQQTLAMGLVLFLSKGLRLEQDDDVNSNTTHLVKWAVEIAKDTLGTGLDIVSSTSII